MSVELPEELQRALRTVVNHFDKEDRVTRERQIREWKKLKYFWDGFQRLWWSEIAHDYQIFNPGYSADGNPNESYGDNAYYDKRVNVFKAYLESIIAALSINVPSVTCFPDDSNNADDLETARTGNKIAEMIYRHNNVILLWLHALFIYCTEGLIASYNYTEEDEKYGTYEVNKMQDVTEEKNINICPNCGQQMADFPKSAEEANKFDPNDDDVDLQNLLRDDGAICDNCMMMVEPILRTLKLTVPKLVGKSTKAKSRQCIEVYGGLFVKVALYARKQAETPYLIYAYETHYGNIVDKYDALRSRFKDIPAQQLVSQAGGMYDHYERWGRLSTQYRGDFPVDTITMRYAWLRPEAFNVLSPEVAIELKKKFPNGAKVVMAGDLFAEACNESLDDHWTLTHNPLSDYLHHDPLGNVLTAVQEITNDLLSLTLQTIEHGIPQTFADPNVLDFDAYRKAEVIPGAIYPARPAAGKTLAEAFHEIKTSTLSAEVMPFAQKVQEIGQLVSGALPSLFGGAAPNSSKTAAQYAMSRSQALQRLQTPWKMLTIWWKEMFGKVIASYIKDVAYDDKFVTKEKNGGFVTTSIERASLTGKIGAVELEASEELPISWSQQKDIIMKLLEMQNPEILQMLGAPENLPYIARAIGLSDFQVPGQDDRIKQAEEIKILLESEPIQGANQVTGQPEMQPSVDVEPMMDNHSLQFQVVRDWVVSLEGRTAKFTNPKGYQNVLLHGQKHMQVMAAHQQPNNAGAQNNGGQQQPSKPAQPTPGTVPSGNV